jgi:hypothetical protein
VLLLPPLLASGYRFAALALDVADIRHASSSSSSGGGGSSSSGGTGTGSSMSMSMSTNSNTHAGRAAPSCCALLAAELPALEAAVARQAALLLLDLVMLARGR